MRGNLAIQIGARERGLVRLVMPVAAVADDVHDNVALELLAKLERQLRAETHGERVVAVHMKDRRLDHLRDVGAILRGARILGQCGESDLVVCDDVDGAADAVAGELRHVQHFRHDPLPCHRRVAVDQNGDHFAPLHRVVAVPLARARHADHDGIHGFEMARVRTQAHVHVFVGRVGLARVHVAEVIFHIAVAIDGIRHEVRVELAEHDAVRLPQKLHDDRKASAVRHAHRDFLHAEARAIFQHRIQRADERLAALDAEPFLPLVGDRVQEPLECLNLIDVPQHPRLRVGVHGPLCAVLDSLAQPVPHAGIRDVHELEADVLAENRLQFCAQVAQRHRRATEEIFRRHGEPEILLVEAEFAQAQQIVLRTLPRERVRLRDRVTERAVGIHEAVHARLERDIAIDLRRRGSTVRSRHAVLEFFKAEMKALAESAEGGLDGFRILQPALVSFIENFRILTGRKGRGHGVQISRRGSPAHFNERTGPRAASRVLVAEKFSKPALQQRREAALQRTALDGLAVRRELVHELREDLRDVAGYLARIDPGLRRNLPELIRAENLLDVLRGRWRIWPGAHPALHEVTETVRTEFLQQPADATAARDEAADGIQKAALMAAAAAEK